MRGPESYSERSKREDREVLLCGAEHETGADDDAKPPVHPVRMRAFFVAAALTVFSSSLGILTTLSQTGGGYKYDYATIPFLAELLKFLVCGYLLWKELKSPQSAAVTTEWSSILLYPIPSIIYLVHNNVLFLTLTYVDTSTHQIMGNLKIVTTGILFRTFLKRKLSKLQWMAIMLLTIGTTVSQVKGCGETNCGSLLAAPIQGYLLGILSACLSALAGVYTEYLMKKNQDSLYWQNMQLYAFGVLFNIARLTVEDVRAGFSNGCWWNRLFNGYDFVTWLVVLNLSCTGLLVSWVMKYADTIVKVYATSMAMLLTMVVSIQLFNLKPTLQLFLGILVCCMSLQLYYTPVEILVGAPTSPPSPPTDASSTLDSEIDTKRKSLSS